MKYAQKLKKSLLSEIDNLNFCRGDFYHTPNKDFTRHRKVTFDAILKAVLSFEGKSLTNELYDIFGFNAETLSASAFVQQRSKIKSEAFYKLFKKFTDTNSPVKLFQGYRLIAVDGSDINTPKNKDDVESIQRNHSAEYNIYHLNVLYDLLTNTYIDALVQKRSKFDEHSALMDMLYRFNSICSAIFIADRGYECYNNMLQIQELNHKFLFRIKDLHSSGILNRFNLPDGEFDISLDIDCSHRKIDKTKINNYVLHIRIVRIRISNDSYEVIATNLSSDAFPASALKELYHKRWGVETSFRQLKYTVGLLAFHSKKAEHIIQEIFARLTLYNFSELITFHLVVQKANRKHIYKINFSIAVNACRKLLLERYALNDVEAVISKNLVPYRPGRSSPRKLRNIPPVSFCYRIA